MPDDQCMGTIIAHESRLKLSVGAKQTRFQCREHDQSAHVWSSLIGTLVASKSDHHCRQVVMPES